MSSSIIPWKKESKYEEQKFYDDLYADYIEDSIRATIYKHDGFWLSIATVSMAIFYYAGVKTGNVFVALFAGVAFGLIFYLVIKNQAQAAAQEHIRIYEVCFAPTGETYTLEHELIAPPVPIIGLTEDEQVEIEKAVERNRVTGNPEDFSRIIEKYVSDGLKQELEKAEERTRRKAKRKWYDPRRWVGRIKSQ